MQSFFYIVRNSFFEQNQSWVSFLTRALQPIVMISGYYIFYRYLLQSDERFSLELYYAYIILVSLIDVPRFATLIQKDIQSEAYLMIDKLPIHPFIYYFWRNIGSSLTTLCACTIIAVATVLSQGMAWPLFILMFCAAIISILLSHILIFTVSTVVFYSEHIHMWMFGILFEFLGGKIIPMIALPFALQTVLTWYLPFGFASGGMANHLAKSDIPAILLSCAIGLIWIALLFSLTKKSWDTGGFYFQERS